jgi:hypothetical protein
MGGRGLSATSRCCRSGSQRLKRSVLRFHAPTLECGANSQKQLCPNRGLRHKESERVTVMFCGAQRDCLDRDAMAHVRKKATKKLTRPRLTITMTPALDLYLKALAKANQRSRAWVINYAINEIREQYRDDPAPVLQLRSSSHPFAGDEDL